MWHCNVTSHKIRDATLNVTLDVTFAECTFCKCHLPMWHPMCAPNVTLNVTLCIWCNIRYFGKCDIWCNIRYFGKCDIQCHIQCHIWDVPHSRCHSSMPHSLVTSACAIHVTLDVTFAECYSYTQHAKKQKKKKWKKREKQNKTNLCTQQGLNPGHTGKKAIDGCLDQTGTAKCWRQSSERTDDRIIEISGITTQGASTPKKNRKRKRQKKREREAE